MRYVVRALFSYLCALLMGLAVASSFAAEKVVKPGDQAQSKAKRESAEWIKRCDRLKENERRACLEEVRAEVHKRFMDEGQQPQPSAAK